MPRRWFQFRLATLMVLVTLSAVGVDYFPRRSRLLEYAELHAAEAKSQWSMARSKMTDWMFGPLQPIPTAEEWAAWQEDSRQLAIHHDQVAGRYRRGAWFPWLVEPTEPPPQRFTLDELLNNRPLARRSLFTLFK
jgi:hypothetical protein